MTDDLRERVGQAAHEAWRAKVTEMGWVYEGRRYDLEDWQRLTHLRREKYITIGIAGYALAEEEMREEVRAADRASAESVVHSRDLIREAHRDRDQALAALRELVEATGHWEAVRAAYDGMEGPVMQREAESERLAAFVRRNNALKAAEALLEKS